MVKAKFKNGQKVRDILTGFEGVIKCVAVYYNGCVRYDVQPALDEKGNYRDSVVIDEQQLKLVMPEKKVPKKKTGGDRPFMPAFKL